MFIFVDSYSWSLRCPTSGPQARSWQSRIICSTIKNYCGSVCWTLYEEGVKMKIHQMACHNSIMLRKSGVWAWAGSSSYSSFTPFLYYSERLISVSEKYYWLSHSVPHYEPGNMGFSHSRSNRWINILELFLKQNTTVVFATHFPGTPWLPIPSTGAFIIVFLGH